jgi:hypothetical protein
MALVMGRANDIWDRVKWTITMSVKNIGHSISVNSDRLLKIQF